MSNSIYYKRITGSSIQGDATQVTEPQGTVVIANDGSLRLHDGTTPGGNPVGGGTANGWQLTSSTYIVNLDGDTGVLTVPGFMNLTYGQGGADTMNFGTGPGGGSVNATAGNSIYVTTNGGSGQWQFGVDGSTTFPNDTILGTGSDPNVYIETVNSGTTSTWTFGTDGTLTTPGSITPNADAQYDLGSTSTRFRAAYVGTGSLFIQDISLGTNAELTVDNGLLSINGISSFKAGSLLIANNTLTTFDTTLDINMGDPGGGDTGGINVYRNIHSVFNNLYETGGQITADTSVQVGRLLISNQPGDANAPGIVTTDTSVDFSLGLPNDTGKVILNRPLVRNGAVGIVDLIPNAGDHTTINTNAATQIYQAFDNTIIAVELTVVLQYGTIADSDTDITKLLIAKNAGGNINLQVLGSIKTSSFEIPSYSAQLSGSGQIQVLATTADTAPQAYVLVKSTEFGGYYGA